MEIDLPDGVLLDAWEKSRTKDEPENQVERFLARTGMTADELTAAAQHMEPWVMEKLSQGAALIQILGGVMGRCIQVGYQMRVNEEAGDYDHSRHD